MSEVDARPAPRGRSSARGGRGGYGRGGPRGGRKQVNGTANDISQVEESLDDQGELGEMKKKYSSELSMLRDMFPDWTDVDLVFALQETDGDIPSTVDHITQGNVSQFAEVKKPKDRARSKVKDDTAMAGATERSSTRGGRGRGGFEGSRGRGRGSDRGRGGYRGGRGGHAATNGTQKDADGTSVPTTESSAWDTPAAATETGTGGWDDTAPEAAKDGGDAGQSAWANVVTAESTPAAASEGAKSSLIPEGGAKKSWASMFAQPKPASAPKPAAQTEPPPKELVASGEVASAPEPLQEPVPESDTTSSPPAPAIEEQVVTPEPVTEVEQPEAPLSATAGEELLLTPPKNPLTEENVELLPEDPHSHTTQTAASTIGSVDTRNLTPLPGQQAPIGRPPAGGYATSAYRATGMPGRSASFQRRVLEQQEAVVMPGHDAVAKAAVQFGSMGLNGEAGLDPDEDREEPETRQAPQHSPPAQPKTALPPAPRQPSAMQEPSMPEAQPTPKQAPGLPPASQLNQQQLQEASLDQGLPQQPPSQMNQAYNAYYGQSGMQQDSSATQQQQQQQPPPQKPYDPFSHQAQPGPYDRYASHPQQPQQHQQGQTGFGGLSSAPSEYSSYYTSQPQRNDNYNQYYGTGAYGPQDARSQLQQDAGMGQQRSTSGFGAGPNESAFGSQAQHQQAQSRYAEAPGSGNNTPNPLMGGQQQSAPHAQQSQHSMHQAPSHQQQGGYGAGSGYPYGHPNYNSPYQQAYQSRISGYNQYGGSYGGGGYPSHQGGMYGGPQGYGMGSQSSYDQHSSSPANAGAFGQNQQSTMRSASGMSSGLSGSLDDYGRSSAQPSAHQQSSAYGGMSDPFARSASGFGAQGGYGQQGMGSGQDDALKGFGDKSGPSPALGQPGRPGSAANAAGSAQSGLPPAQGQQSGSFGAYAGFPGQGGSQYGGLGGLGSHQQGQSGMGGQGQYGGGYGGGFGQTYGSYGASRGGWGQNYGH